MTRVKICGLTTPDATELACELGADALGFVFYAASSRAVTAAQAKALTAHVAPLVSTVALFVDPTADDVRRVLDECAVDVLQFHGQEPAAFCEQFGRPYIKAVSMRPKVEQGGGIAATLDAHPQARAFLFDAWRADAPGGTGETFAWDRLPVLSRPWLLAGGLKAENVAQAIAQTAAPAVDVSGGVESAPGIKDPTRLRQFFAAVRQADQRRHEDAAA